MPSKIVTNDNNTWKNFNILASTRFLILRAELTTNQNFLQYILIFCGQLPIGVQRFLTTPYFLDTAELCH